MRTGEKVTVVVEGLLVHARIAAFPALRKGYYRTDRLGMAGRVPLKVEVADATEGALWTHGHVTADSEAGKALLAAHAMEAEHFYTVPAGALAGELLVLDSADPHVLHPTRHWIAKKWNL